MTWTSREDKARTAVNAPELHVMEAMQGEAVGVWVIALEVLRADKLVALRGR
jgi:hypothetical protein